MEYMPYVWLSVAVVLAIVEISTTQLVSLWFVLGAAVTAVCSATFLKNQLIWQIIIFLFISAVLLLLTRPFVKKLKTNDGVRTNSDRNIGKIALVISDINPDKGTGQVRVGSEKWSAKTIDGSVIKEGTNVKVVAIEGVKLIVTADNI
ncbi:MAG: NfeD family protein [Ruminococcus sp.]|nr:NfeD family protein [Ruminococcus sp.]